MRLAGKLEGLSLDINRQMTTTSTVISDLQQAQKVHSTDLATLSARLDRVEGRHRGRSPQHSSLAISAEMTCSRHPTPMSRSCPDAVRDVAKLRQRTPVSNVHDTTQMVDILFGTVADMPESMGTSTARGLTRGRPCRAQCTSSEMHCVDETGVPALLHRQEEHVPRKSLSGLISPAAVLQRCATSPAPPPHMAAQALSSASATALAAPTASAPQVYQKPQQSQSQVPPLAWAEQCYRYTSQQQDGNKHPGVRGRAAPTTERCNLNMALVMAGSVQRSGSLHSGVRTCPPAGMY